MAESRPTDPGTAVGEGEAPAAVPVSITEQARQTVRRLRARYPDVTTDDDTWAASITRWWGGDDAA